MMPEGHLLRAAMWSAWWLRTDRTPLFTCCYVVLLHVISLYSEANDATPARHQCWSGVGRQ